MIASACAGNVIGGGDFADNRIVPDCYRAMTGNAALEVRNPQAVRPWQHVLEPLFGYLTLIAYAADNKCDAAGCWNFGPGRENEQPVAVIVQKLFAFWQRDASWDHAPNPDQKETHVLRLDAAKAQQKLSWMPRLNFDQTLAWTAQWYLALHQGKDIRALTLSQIDDYLHL